MDSRFYPDEVYPRVLEGSDIRSLAKYMKSDDCQNVFLMLGAGVSTSAGIPDFRSPETGLYANLARSNLPYPEAVFEIDFFRRNPVPFYTLAKELYPGRYQPTITHAFIKVLHTHGLLHTCFTQNIDTLERRAGIPERKIVEAHGSFAAQRCIDCKCPYDGKKIKNAIINSVIPRCEHCNGLVKPDIVFFGEALPLQFHASIHSLRKADLLIVLGTSLTVHPFASLVDMVPEDCPRVLINLDEVGAFNKQDDIVLLGKCDDIVQELCCELGWEEELESAWMAAAEHVQINEEPDVLELGVKVDEELDHITRDIKESLAISDDTSGSLPDSPIGETQKQKKSLENGEVDEKEVEGKPTDLEDGKL